MAVIDRFDKLVVWGMVAIPSVSVVAMDWFYCFLTSHLIHFGCDPLRLSDAREESKDMNCAR